ncbi:acetyltransferase A, auxiliary subunit [Artemisia annua]|uniref:Acetyltransferase A, auxiliary subunit n=1 Tax=Artemisia annua TaxID=35608 RepID=A0A2U1KY73_ARTAN|nr:acetyltransferase A, auxiliary subunit [Artemisia annua]
MADEPQPIDPPPPTSVDATIDSTGGTMSTCNTNNIETSDDDKAKSLEYAEELMEKGYKASKEDDYAEATDCYSRALEIRAAHYGELAPECVRSYYKYGCALLYKAQEESDPLVSGAVSKKESAEHGDKGSAKGAESGETSVSSKGKEGTSTSLKAVSEDGGDEEDQEEDAEGTDDEEDESDLDLAWKMLDVARAIAEKQPGDTMEKVDILSALAEVALEREDVETSLSDYLKALSMLERLAEPDSRHIAELNFRICLCLEIGQKGDEAIPYCQKAISVCKSRLQRLAGELESSSSSKPSANPESGLLGRQSSSASQTTDSVADKEKEIEILTGLSSELEKKLEDLQQSVANPSSILSEILGMVAAKANSGQTSVAAASASASASGMTSSRMGTADSSGFESPTVSTAHTNSASGVTHLGVVGRGVKRVNMSSVATESTAAKKQASDASADNGGSS